MTVEQILITIIVLLVGLIVGGAGGTALIRRATGRTISPEDTTAATTAAAAATAAAASSAAVALNGQVARLQESVDKQWDTLNNIREQQTHLATAFEQFPEMCKLKHEAIDRDQTRMQAEIDILQKKS